MQILFRNNRPERIFADFRDANYQSVPPSGSISVSIQDQYGNYKVTNASALYLTDGVFAYELTVDDTWDYGYYAAWWRDDLSGYSITPDIPNIFKIESQKDAIAKAIMVERVRSSLYMHQDMGGFADKFPRDREILDYLQQSLNWFNAHPPILTLYSFSDLPENITYIIERGAVLSALIALGILEAGKHFSYNDNGLSLTRDRSGKYSQIYAALLQQYSADLKALKMKIGMSSIQPKGMFSSTTGFPRSLSRALRGVSKAI